MRVSLAIRIRVSISRYASVHCVSTVFCIGCGAALVYISQLLPSTATLTTIFIATPFPRSTPWSCLLSAHTLVFWPMDLLACSAAVVNGLAPTALPQRSIFSAFLAAPSANVPLDVSFEALHGPANTHHLVVTDSKPFHTAQNLPRL